MWLAGLDCDRPAMVGAREVTVGGRVTVASRRRVPGSWLAAAVHGGLVVQRGRSLLVWDPSTEEPSGGCPSRPSPRVAATS